MSSHRQTMKTSLPLLSALALCLSIAPASAGTYTVLHSFADGPDGARPLGAVIQDNLGNLYGETEYGGAVCNARPGLVGGRYGCGTVYKIDSTGALTTLVTFDKANGTFGEGPLTLIGSTLYGTAYHGGPKDDGVLFSLNTDGSHFKILHRFRGTDGSDPAAALRPGPNGVAYGVTSAGGPGFPSTSYGVLFELKPDDTYTILHTFTAGTDGSYPGNIIVSPAGVIFGATAAGGTKCPGYNQGTGCGVIYQFVPSTGVFTALHTFDATAQGYGPVLGSLGADGTLYGATTYGGIDGPDGEGTLFSLATTGANTPLITLTSFTGVNGAHPISGPLLRPDGALIGTTAEGSTNDRGTLYHFAAGLLTDDYAFGDHLGQGTYPESQPIEANSGAIFGTAAAGGPQNPLTYGTVYRITP